MFEGSFLKRIGITSICLMISVQSLAETVSQIDAIEQTYHLHSKHIIDDVIIEKHYSSKSEFRGRFGFGWCSDLDGKVEKYADLSVRYNGCDISTAMLLDPRFSAKEVLRTMSGYRRVREDGAIQSFDTKGRLISLRFAEGTGRDPLLINYNQSDAPDHLLGARTRVDIRYDKNFGLIETLRGRATALQFAYRLDFLIFNETETYDYGFHRGLTRRSTTAMTESVEYRSAGRSVSRVEKRFRASPEERLLMSLVGDGESEEIQINAERGAEMRPVRILYHMQRKTLDLIGDRETARRILDWIKS